MAVYNWLGRAAARAQVSTVTPSGTIEVGDIFYCTINGKSISFTATGTTVANVVAGLVAAWNASEITEFAAITATDSTTHMTLTADTAGVPFVVTVSTTESNGGAADAQSISTATTTTATGPNNWNDANNWDGATIPTTGDTANVDLSLNSVLYGLDQNTVTLASLYVYTSRFTTNTLGLPSSNENGYTEYLDQYLKISATSCVIDADSPRIKLDFGSAANATEIRRTGTSTEFPTPAVLIKGTNIGNTMDVVSGSVGLAYYEGESYNAASLTTAQGATVNCGTGAAITDTVSTGQTVFKGTGTNFQTDGGTAEILGTPGFSTLTCSDGQTLVKFGGTVVDVVVGPGTIDTTGDVTPRTFTNCTIEQGGQIIDPNETITYTNGFQPGDGVSSLQAA